MLIIKQLILVGIIAAMNIKAVYATLLPHGEPVTGSVFLNNSENSAIKWTAPNPGTYKIHVFSPSTHPIPNARYRVYPKGKEPHSVDCNPDTAYPCYEVTVDQTLRPHSWVQLTLNEDPETQWDFVKDQSHHGYVAAVANDLNSEETLHVSGVVYFEYMNIRVGQAYQGGIVFKVDSTGHGFIAAPSDQSFAIPWADLRVAYMGTSASDTAIGTGQTNTNKIIARLGSGSYAARLCADLVIEQYSDWYLPSIDELSLMYKNIGPKAAAPLTNIGGFTTGTYWSSSEAGGTQAWSQTFGSNSSVSYAPLHYDKSYNFRTRAIRSF